MNYIKLLNAFYDRLETNPLSTSAIVLWHALVNVNNKTGWRNEFSVAVSVLRIKTGLSEKSVTNARNELDQKGYLLFKSRKGNQSALYQIIDLSVTVTDKLADNTSYSSSDNTTDNTSVLLNKTKRNETKEDDKARESNPFQFFEEEGFGTLSATIGETLGDLIDEFGEARVIAAMKESVIYGARNLAYVTKILKNPNSTKPKGASTHGKSGGTPQKSNDDSGVDW